MALDSRHSHIEVSTGDDAITALFNNGYIRVYDGTRPANANTALSGNTLGAELRFGSPAFGAAVNGVATANAITGDTGRAAITPTFARCLKSDGTTVLFDGSYGTASANFIGSSATIAIGQSVQINSFTLTISETGT